MKEQTAVDQAGWPQSPFDRSGWWIALPWLLFMAPPLISIWTDVTSAVLQIVGTALCLMFVVVYVFGFWHNTHKTSRNGFATSTRLLVVLIGISVALAWIDPWTGLGVLPFVVTFANFTVGLPLAIGVLVTAVGVSIVGPVLDGTFDQMWFFALIVFCVGGGTLIVRALSDRADNERVHHLQLAATDERLRVARDVHDVLGHSLTAVILKAELSRRLLDSVIATPDSEASLRKARAELDELHAVSRTALNDIRSTVGGLRVADIADELRVGKQILNDAGVTLTVVGNPDDLLAPQRALFGWVVRESITNIVRHAKATDATIEIAADHIRVTDNGIGAAHTLAGVGLKGLSERLTAINGALSVESPATGGTVLTATI